MVPVITPGDGASFGSEILFIWQVKKAVFVPFYQYSIFLNGKQILGCFGRSIFDLSCV